MIFLLYLVLILPYLHALPGKVPKELVINRDGKDGKLTAEDWFNGEDPSSFGNMPPEPERPIALTTVTSVTVTASELPTLRVEKHPDSSTTVLSAEPIETVKPQTEVESEVLGTTSECESETTPLETSTSATFMSIANPGPGPSETPKEEVAISTSSEIVEPLATSTTEVISTTLKKAKATSVPTTALTEISSTTLAVTPQRHSSSVSQEELGTSSTECESSSSLTDVTYGSLTTSQIPEPRATLTTEAKEVVGNTLETSTTPNSRTEVFASTSVETPSTSISTETAEESVTMSTEVNVHPAPSPSSTTLIETLTTTHGPLPSMTVSAEPSATKKVRNTTERGTSTPTTAVIEMTSTSLTPTFSTAEPLKTESTEPGLTTTECDSSTTTISTATITKTKVVTAEPVPTECSPTTTLEATPTPTQCIPQPPQCPARHPGRCHRKRRHGLKRNKIYKCVDVGDGWDCQPISPHKVCR